MHRTLRQTKGSDDLWRRPYSTSAEILSSVLLTAAILWLVSCSSWSVSPSLLVPCSVILKSGYGKAWLYHFQIWFISSSINSLIMDYSRPAALFDWTQVSSKSFYIDYTNHRPFTFVHFPRRFLWVRILMYKVHAFSISSYRVRSTYEFPQRIISQENKSIITRRDF